MITYEMTTHRRYTLLLQIQSDFFPPTFTMILIKHFESSICNLFLFFMYKAIHFNVNSNQIPVEVIIISHELIMISM